MTDAKQAEAKAEATAASRDWFARHADFRNPDAFVNTDPRYFASECAAAILNGRLVVA